MSDISKTLPCPWCPGVEHLAMDLCTPGLVRETPLSGRRVRFVCAGLTGDPDPQGLSRYPCTGGAHSMRGGNAVCTCACHRAASKPTLNFNDPTLDETEMLPRSVGWSLSEENYPSLARFRFPGIEAPPSETPPAAPPELPPDLLAVLADPTISLPGDEGAARLVLTAAVAGRHPVTAHAARRTLATLDRLLAKRAADRQSLEAAQAREQRARQAVYGLLCGHGGPLAHADGGEWCSHGLRRAECGLCDDSACHAAHAALAEPADTTALDARLAAERKATAKWIVEAAEAEQGCCERFWAGRPDREAASAAARRVLAAVEAAAARETP